MIISKKQPTYLSLFTCVLACLMLTSCDIDDKPGSAPRPASKVSTHRVEIIPAEIKAVSLSQTISGTLEAVTRIRLYNEESGRITRLPFHEGDSVKKGALLVQMDDALLKTDVAKAKAAREQAKLDLSRLKKLLPKKISTEEEVARARTELDLAIAEETRQLTRLKRTSIRAPINGLITRRLFEPGDILPQYSHIHSIIDPTELRLKASIAERWLPLVYKDQSVRLQIDALGDTTFAARVVRIHPTIDASTHKGLIEIRLSPVPDGAAVGQFARATIALEATDRLVIPVHTVHYEPEGAYVYRIIDDENGDTVAEKVSFQQGQQFGDIIEVQSGLQPGDRIVSRGYLGLRNGKKVSIANADVTATGASTATTEAH